ncbi:hypothetical protein ABOM_008049 [Aspergillus bombycis]|uniref:Uncharacterized protein n=1 Tax=Aspergillus bombycis TaxID=109264 RepID=A0A1F7ZW55_9EURO|nr:hypothetical protein ABOM_008049 [Aspergillus bombycis]OGM43489.1 hypothetical protein ABOM_008049 [Aspergillus bombycis]
MFSYHRVLKLFGRSIHDKTLQCDCDIHPWEITINKERWTNKIRLIGFIDVFFVISYSANDRFEQGIIVYKDDDDEDKTHDPKQAAWKENRSYKTTSLGHKIELRTEYPGGWIKPYEICIHKPMNWAMASELEQVRRGIKPHGIWRLARDVIDCGIITEAQFLGHILGAVLAGSTADDVLRKVLGEVGSYNHANRLILSNDNV